MPAAADSIISPQTALPLPMASDTLLHTLDQAIAAPCIECTPPLQLATITAPPPPPAWTTGLEGSRREVSIGQNSGVLAIIAIVSLLMMLSYRRSRRLFSVLTQELLGMRRRENAFDERTSNETTTLMLMGLQWCVSIGLLLYSAIAMYAGAVGLDVANVFADTAKLIGLAAAYYIFQLAAYWTLGYTFTTPEGRKLYVQGFTSSQSLVGFFLIIPALLSIFYPVATIGALWCAAIFYIVARIIFIIKGFKIFYTNFGSLFYFISYLCTLEIAPALLVCRIAFAMVVNF